MKQRAFLARVSFALVVLLFLSCFSSPADPLDNWTLRAQFGLFTGDDLFSVVQGGRTTVAVGTIPGTIFYSTNLDTWNYTGNSATNGLNGEYFYGVGYNNKEFIAVGFSVSPIIMVSTNGVNWKTAYTGTGFGPSDTFRGIVCTSNITVAVGTAGLIVVSANGTNWTSVVSGTSNDLKAIAYANGLFIAGDANGGVLLSTDGLGWSRKPTATTGRINGVAYGNNMFVAVGGTSATNGFIETSTNGVDWTLRLTLVSFRNCIGYSAGMFVAPGNQGSIYSSRDGLSWSSRTNLATQHTINSIIDTDSTFLAVGYKAVIIQSDPLVKLLANNASTPQFTLSGLTNRSYQIDKSDVLTGSNWLPRATVALSNAPVIWTDDTATNSAAFYRALLLP